MTKTQKVTVLSRRRSMEAIESHYPGAFIVDVTSKGSLPWVKFSPFYPHGGIPVPFSPGLVAESVEGIWQGLKVFELSGVDRLKFDITEMKGIKRSCRKFGRVLGHQKGMESSELLSYIEARWAIYLPCYRYVLDNFLKDEVSLLRDVVASNRMLIAWNVAATGVNGSAGNFHYWWSFVWGLRCLVTTLYPLQEAAASAF